MAESSLSADEICRILEASAKAGVRVLKFGTLEATFEPSGVVPPTATDQRPAPPTPAAEIAEPNHERQTRESIELDELALREDQVGELLLSDPLEAERLISEGELGDNERRSDDGEDA